MKSLRYPRINLDSKKSCSYCNKEKQVWVYSEKHGLMRNIKKLPNGLFRCIPCDLVSSMKMMEQEAFLEAKRG